ncbi:MAG: acetylserotonin O-methyltransferase [Burkholderiales bacterium]|nr:acetylserotonin O-methyltransferase [Burkholderiales bacterium]
MDAVLPWLDRWHTARDRVLASRRFQRWAAGFPLTRWVARRRARALFDLCAGFVYSQVLAAFVRLRLPEILLEGPRTVAALAPRLALSESATARLLAAAVSLRLAAPRGGGRFGLGPLGAALAGNSGVAAMVEHHALLYGDLADPVALLRGERPPTGLSGYWAYASASDPAALDGERVAAYTSLMAASQTLVADEILDAYPLGGHRTVLDVGGGDGAFLARVGARWPALRLLLFDLPPVAERARSRFAACGLADRATAYGGDFRSAPLPRGADAATLVRVLHDHDDEPALALLAAVWEALAPGGTVLVAEPMSGTAGAEPVGDAYFGFYLLAMGSGRPRSAREVEALLARAGFERIRRLATRNPVAASIVVGRRPS